MFISLRDCSFEDNLDITIQCNLSPVCLIDVPSKIILNVFKAWFYRYPHHFLIEISELLTLHSFKARTTSTALVSKICNSLNFVGVRYLFWWKLTFYLKKKNPGKPEESSNQPYHYSMKYINMYIMNMCFWFNLIFKSKYWNVIYDENE